MLKQQILGLSDKQKSAIRASNKPINLWYGAVRSGKTYSSLIRFLIEIDEANPGDMVVVCRDAFSFRRNILPQLYELVGQDVLFNEGKGLLTIWGRKIHIVGAHDARAEGKLRGATFAGAYVDEATLIPQSAWIVLTQRCAMNGAKIFATTNPDSPFHWLKREVVDNNPDCISFHFTMLDNPKLKDEERAYIERQHKGLWYKRFVLGDWCLAEGCVFDFFEEPIHVIKRPPSYAKYHVVGVDYGTVNPTAFTLIGFNNDVSPNLWVEKEYYWDTRKTGRQKTDGEIAQDLIEFCELYGPRAVYMDPSAASLRAELRKQGSSLHIAKETNNDVLFGIRVVGGYLSNGDLKICANCTNLIGEMQSYSWDPKAAEKGEDEPIKRMDHAIDSMRYALATHKFNAPYSNDNNSHTKYDGQSSFGGRKLYEENITTTQRRLY